MLSPQNSAVPDEAHRTARGEGAATESKEVQLIAWLEVLHKEAVGFVGAGSLPLISSGVFQVPSQQRIRRFGIIPPPAEATNS
jgi:hypothetical protein